MLETLQYILSLLQNDSTLTAIIPSTNMFVGPLDLTIENQSYLYMPQINIRLVSETSRSVPTNARDTLIQVDIWSITSQLETVNAYEAVIGALNYKSGDQSTAHIFWERLGGAVDDYETDRRVWHRAVTINVWGIK